MIHILLLSPLCTKRIWPNVSITLQYGTVDFWMFQMDKALTLSEHLDFASLPLKEQVHCNQTGYYEI